MAKKKDRSFCSGSFCLEAAFRNGRPTIDKVGEIITAATEVDQGIRSLFPKGSKHLEESWLLEEARYLGGTRIDANRSPWSYFRFQNTTRRKQNWAICKAGSS